MTSSVPGAPQNLVAVVSRNTVFFTWQAPNSSSREPVQTYVLDAGGAPGATQVSLPLGDVLSFSATVPDAVYYVRLRAVTPAGSGPVSNEVQIALGQSAPPQPPLALLATVQGTAVTLQWTENPLGPVIGAYQLQAGTATGLVDVGAFPLPATQRSGRHLLRAAGGAERRRRERGVERSDRHERSGRVHHSRRATGLTATSAAGVISVGWSPAAAGAIPLGYQLIVGSVSGGADRAVVALPASRTAIGGAVPAGPYFIRLAAANACGVSAPSADVSVVVP